MQISSESIRIFPEKGRFSLRITRDFPGKRGEFMPGMLERIGRICDSYGRIYGIYEAGIGLGKLEYVPQGAVSCGYEVHFRKGICP